MECQLSICITLTDNKLSCSISAVGTDSKYDNVNWNIYANLNFSCKINGKQINADPYRITSELKPRIEYVNVIKTIQHPEQQTYDIRFEIKYFESNQININVEESDSGLIIYKMQSTVI